MRLSRGHGARARAALDEERDRAEAYVGELYSKGEAIMLPVRMDRTQQVIDEIPGPRSGRRVEGWKIPSYLMNTVKKAQGKATTTYDPETFVITEVPQAPPPATRAT